MEYKLIGDSSNEGLSEKVNELLAKGWELYGYPFSDSFSNSNSGQTWICQAMIKRKEYWLDS